MPQIPIKYYFDDELLKKEKEKIFSAAPKYVGHELTIPNIGDFNTVYWEKEGRILIRNKHGIELISNVCRHRQAKILSGRGNINNIVCPIHGWTYDLRGKLIGAPNFKKIPCLSLSDTPLSNWNGLLFEKKETHIKSILKNFSVSELFNFENYIYDHTEYHECNYNWKTFIEVYLEDYHVNSFHPGLGNFVDCSELIWEFGNDFSVQKVGINEKFTNFGSKKYEAWQKEILKINGENLPKYGAVWVTIFPNIMLEWYPYVLVVSTLWPVTTNKTLNVVEFFYPDNIFSYERSLIDAEREAYFETCQEDDIIAVKIESGRKILMEKNLNEIGPYQSPMEDGMHHFHEWYISRI